MNLPEDSTLDMKIADKINSKTKPPGSLGELEKIAARICRIQRSIEPRLERPTMVVFAADHGITAENVSAYPQDVTTAMVRNFLAGGAAINVFCRLHAIDLRVVDAGIVSEVKHPQLMQGKINRGTRNFRHEPAMTVEEAQQAMELGAGIVRRLAETGVNTLGLGEMGIGNTSSAAVLMHVLTEIPLTTCVGRGTGLAAAQMEHKRQVLMDAVARHGRLQDPLQALTCYGGFELAAMVGAIRAAHAARLVTVIDGFPCSAAALVAIRMQPAVRETLFFSHVSAEQGHQALLQALDATPLLNLGMRLGEGTGAALAVPLLRAAVAFLSEMATFETAGITRDSSI